MNDPAGPGPVDPIAESLPYDSDVPEEVQNAWHAVVHLVVPCRDRNGAPVDTETEACDYIAETLRERFLDWGYVETAGRDRQRPIPISVSRPYVEGTFLDDSAGTSEVPPDAVSELVAQCGRLGIEAWVLDELVHEFQSAEASDLNNGGPASQLAYLVERLGVAGTRDRLELGEDPAC